MTSLEELLGKSLVWAYFTVFGAGVATSLTPCVYPMIPITLSIFGGGKGGNRFRAVLLAMLYIFGMATMYTGLGILAALGGWAVGHLLASPWFIVPLALLFLLLAASLFGLWEIRMPAGLQTWLGTRGGSSLTGAFVLGLVGGVLIAPCTGPVLAALLAWVATRGDLFLGGTLLFTYALGIGVLFWFLAVFAVRLPKSGPWMESVKSFLGIGLVVAALFYLQNVWPQLAAYASATKLFLGINVLLVVLGVFLGAVHLSFSGAKRIVAARKVLGILVLSVGIFGLINYALTPKTKLPWLRSEPEALALAKKEQRPVFVDFWAQWCLPCKELEEEILSKAPARKALSRFVLLKIDVTKDTPADRRLQEKYSATELPQLIVLDSDGTELGRRGKLDSLADLLALLNRATR